ncbi:hypothetical protein F4780DRAFT_63628 [Xylariomycetidae sp. FL0641]|nr:hypothetical protein F4780DRAFT_63628 [Xylariomycetidae sp. FL0641]
MATHPRIFVAMALLLLFTLALANPVLHHAVDERAALIGTEICPNPLGLAARWYPMSSPAAAVLERRQQQQGDDADDDEVPQQCPSGQHSCVEIGPAGAAACCANDQYCFLDEDWAPACCALGLKCPGSACEADQLFCNTTTTSTITLTTAPTTSLLATDIPSPACCRRPCDEASFSCQAYYGGQCCPYGASCATGGLCLAGPTGTSGSSSSSSVSTVVSMIPPGCTAATQISCPASLGGGCCDVGSTCTVQTLTGDEVPATAATATASVVTSNVCAPNLTVVASDDAGGGGGGALSTGAKAGVGIGVTLGAAAGIGLLTWFFFRQRRRQHGTRGAGAPGGTMPYGGADMADAAGAADYADGHTLRNPLSPYPAGAAGGVAPSEASSGPTSSGGGGGHSRPYRYDYFGPDAVPGPYTDGDGRAVEYGGEDGVGQQQQQQQQQRESSSAAGVVVYGDAMMSGNHHHHHHHHARLPQNPSDIRRPVELDSRLVDVNHNYGKAGDVVEETVPLARGGGTGATTTPAAREEEEEEERDGPHELFSPASPSPFSPDEAGYVQARNTVSPSPPPP